MESSGFPPQEVSDRFQVFGRQMRQALMSGFNSQYLQHGRAMLIVQAGIARNVDPFFHELVARKRSEHFIETLVSDASGPLLVGFNLQLLNTAVNSITLGRRQRGASLHTGRIARCWNEGGYPIF